MLAQVPPIAEFVVALEELYSVAFREAQFVGTAGFEVVCGGAGQPLLCRQQTVDAVVEFSTAAAKERSTAAIGLLK